MKRVCSLLLVALLTLALVGCGGGKAKEVNVAALADELANTVQFDSELKRVSLDNYLTVPEGAEAAAYMSTGTTAEEIIVVRCADDGEAKTMKAGIESFLADQRAEMERYQPEEVARMEKAVLAQKGSYVVLCVTSDTDKAESIIKEHLG